MSSAKTLKVNLFEAVGKTLIYSRKNSGPNVEPRGTQHVIVFRLDSALPTLTYC